METKKPATSSITTSLGSLELKIFIAYDDETTEIAIIQMVIKRIIKWLNSKKLTNNKYNNKAPKVPKVPGSFGK